MNDDKIDHISVSQINEYLGCQQQYWFHRIAGVPESDVSCSLVVGSACHCAIEMYHKSLMTGNPADLVDMTAVFDQIITEEKDAHRINWGRTSRAEESARAAEMFKVYLEGRRHNEVVAVEEMFRLELDGLPVPLIGRIDLIERDRDGVVQIIDFKTSKTKPLRSTDPAIPDDVDANLQMTIYGMWGKQHFTGERVGLCMDYLVKTKTPQYMRLPTARTENDNAKAVVLVGRVWNQLEMTRSGVIEPLPVRSFRCAGCGWREACLRERREVA